MALAGKSRLAPDRPDGNPAGLRPVLVSLLLHVLLGAWVLSELILSGGAGGEVGRQLEIENEMSQAAAEAPPEDEVPLAEEPTAESEPDAPAPQIDDARVLPAPWRRPNEAPEQEAREDLKRPSVVMKRARPLPGHATETADPEPREAEPADAAAETRDAAPGLPAPIRMGATKIIGECPHPEYPARARQRGLQGRVILLVDVGEDGRVLDVTIQTESGHDILDRAAVAAVRAWRFTPAREGDRPVRDRLQIPITFRLR